MASVFLTAIFLCGLSKAFADPCQTYTDLKGSDQRRPENKHTSGNAICDVTVIAGWYRLKMGDADADLVVSTSNPPPLTSCGTLFPVYLTDALPTTPDTEITLAASVAGFLTIPVKVKNCGSYNVYNLQPPQSCPTAYCFATNGPCPPGQSSENGRQPGCSANFPSINITPTVTPVIGKSNALLEDLRFRCEFNRPGNDELFYDVVWYVNEVEVKRFKSVSSNALPHSTELLEEHWFPRFKLGMNVVCGIRARFSVTSTPSPTVKSQVFFAGIKVEGETSIQLKEDETKSVQFRSTVPIPCIAGILDCELQVKVTEVFQEQNDRCTLNNKVGECDIRIPAARWSEVQTLNVTGRYDPTYGNQLSRLLMRAFSTVPGRQLWSNVQPAVVQINVLDLDVNTQGKFCRVYNDPHFHSFDEKLFDVHQYGEFVLYRHKQLPLEVRGFFQPCGRTSIHCVCGAAVRSGPQLFVWSTCKDNLNSVPFQTTRISVYGDCNKKQMRVTSPQDSSVFQIELPSGTKVIINTRSKFISIHPSPADIDQVTGLCGNFNGNATDEFVDKTGKLHANCERNFCRAPVEYSQSWRIERAESYYNGLLVHQLGEPLQGHCRCEANQVICESAPPKQCNPQHVEEVTDTYCTQLSRRKRQAVRLPSVEDPVPIFPEGPVLTPNTKPQFRNGWTESRAKAYCQQAFDRLPANAPCSRVPQVNNNNLILSCIQDILLTGDTEFTRTSLEVFKLQCLTEVSKNTSLWTGGSEEVSLFEEVLNNSCPNDCSSRGRCFAGRCVCPEQAWIGPDCSVPANRPPNIIRLGYNGTCDKSEHDCSQVTVWGGDFVESDSLTCRFRQFVGAGAVLVNVTKAIFRSSSEIICPLNQPLNLPFNVYRLSVSNKDSIYSQEVLYLKHGPCFNCFILGNTFTCSLKACFEE